MVLPGLIAAALYPAEMEEDSNRAFPLLVKKLLPPGLVGLMTAAMLSSFMGALASCFNSVSTLFTMDVYRMLFPDASETQLVFAGRTFTLLVACAAIMWLPVILNADGQLFLYIQNMQNIWASPVTVVFVASVISKKVSASTATVTLVVGLSIGVATWMLQNVLTAAMLVGYEPLLWLQQLSILLFAPLLAAICTLVLLIAHYQEHYMISRMTEASSLVPNQRDSVDYTQRVARQEWAGPVTACMGLAVVVLVTGLTFALA
jgi:uncharacterized sodium:solute symporter family permease YidK